MLVLLPFASAEQAPDFHNPYAPIYGDKPSYTWTDKVIITIAAPSWNTNRHLIDSIGHYPENPIKISTRDSSLEGYRLVETSSSSGIFRGEIILTGFLHDVDGDGRPDTTPRTGGSGPTSGYLETKQNSALTVSFEFADGVVLTKSFPISWNLGTIQFTDVRDQNMMVRVIDPDMNLSPERVDSVSIHVYSDSDTAGMKLSGTETSIDSGVFDASFLIGDNPNRLYATGGDIIHAKYQDRTLPLPYDTSDELDIIAQTRLITDPTSVTIHDVYFADTVGNRLTEISANQSVQIASRLAGHPIHDVNFTYYVQIKDDTGKIVHLSWVSSLLYADSSIDVTQSWTPVPGQYIIETFVWDSQSMTPLSAPYEIRVLISG